jgi:hypothetical protein
MIKFKKFILEGGNLPFEINGQMKTADPVKSSDRASHQQHFHDFFTSIENGIKKAHGKSVFGNSLNSGSAYSGSAREFMRKDIPHEEFQTLKPKLGDFDAQINEKVRPELNQFLKPGDVHGRFKIVHTRTTGNQTHAIVQHLDTGKHHQIDFEPVEYDEKTQEPTQFEQQAHSSPIEDLRHNIKGAHGKLWAQSISHAWSVPSIISKMKGRGKARTETQEEGNVAEHSLSVDKGMRRKWKQTGTHESGKPIMSEIPTSESTYTKDLPTIHRTLFKAEGTPEDHQKIGSFTGGIDLVKKHIPQEHHEKIIKTFANKLWHHSAQAFGNDPEEDKKAKDAAWNHLKLHFPRETSAIEKEVNQQREEYYNPNNPKSKFKLGVSDRDEDSGLKESDDGEQHHVVFAAGRFTGPTEEHHKLLKRVFGTPADSHRVYVMGPESKEKTTDKDPLTVEEKISQLKKLYPEKADSFIAGTDRHTKNPLKALVHTWHSLKKPGRKVHITVHAGEGEEGVKSKSSAGGSIDSYKGLVDKYNKTSFPESVDEQGNKRGGDLRMDYESAKFIGNPRGKTSGSVMRQTARSLDHNNPEHVAQFKKLLHPNFSHEDAKGLMQKIKDRSKPLKECSTVFEKVKWILG